MSKPAIGMKRALNTPSGGNSSRDNISKNVEIEVEANANEMSINRPQAEAQLEKKAKIGPKPFAEFDNPTLTQFTWSHNTLEQSFVGRQRDLMKIYKLMYENEQSISSGRLNFIYIDQPRGMGSTALGKIILSSDIPMIPKALKASKSFATFEADNLQLSDMISVSIDITNYTNHLFGTKTLSEFLVCVIWLVACEKLFDIAYGASLEYSTRKGLKSLASVYNELFRMTGDRHILFHFDNISSIKSYWEDEERFTSELVEIHRNLVCLHASALFTGDMEFIASKGNNYLVQFCRIPLQPIDCNDLMNTSFRCNGANITAALEIEDVQQFTLRLNYLCHGNPGLIKKALRQICFEKHARKSFKPSHRNIDFLEQYLPSVAEPVPLEMPPKLLALALLQIPLNVQSGDDYFRSNIAKYRLQTKELEDGKEVIILPWYWFDRVKLDYDSLLHVCENENIFHGLHTIRILNLQYRMGAVESDTMLSEKLRCLRNMPYGEVKVNSSFQVLYSRLRFDESSFEEDVKSMIDECTADLNPKIFVPHKKSSISKVFLLVIPRPDNQLCIIGMCSEATNNSSMDASFKAFNCIVGFMRKRFSSADLMELMICCPMDTLDALDQPLNLDNE